MDKKALRREIGAKKSALTPDEIERRSAILADRLFDTPQYRGCRALYAYLSFNQEVRTNPIIERAWADGKGLPLTFFSADALNAVPGEFTASAFVLKTVGVDNVCERAAMASAGEGARLIVKKTSLNGVTVAAALEKWSVCFE